MSENIAPAASGQGTPAAGAITGDTGGTPQTPQDWTTGFNDDLKGYVQNKGFKDPTSVLDSYRNLEKLMGAPKERLLKLPEKADDEAGWNEVFTKIGRPDKADDYKIEVPKDVGDDGFAKWAQGTFHKLGISKSQGEKLASEWNGYMANFKTQHQEAHNAKITEQENTLKKEWGAAFDQNMNIGKHAAREFGLDVATIDKIESALGFADTIKLFHNIGSKIGEDKFVSGGNRSGFEGAMTPEQARNQINNLRGDSDFVKRYTNGDVSAKAEMERLHKYAYPE